VQKALSVFATWQQRQQQHRAGSAVV